nr:MAG TPA: putative terminase small subunit [Caudoviricetes sp.]
MAGEETKTKGKGGRPKKYIDKQLFEQLCGLQCTLEEMEAFFNCDHKTIARWCRETYEGRRFSQVFREKRQIGKISLRRKQLRLAERSAAMAIFLGKNYLGQKDEPEEAASVEDAVSIVDDVPNMEVKSNADEY